MSYKDAFIYRHLLANPPLLPNGARRRGSGHWDEFWRGYDGHRSISAASSAGRKAWRAGRDYRRANPEVKRG